MHISNRFYMLMFKQLNSSVCLGATLLLYIHAVFMQFVNYITEHACNH